MPALAPAMAQAASSTSTIEVSLVVEPSCNVTANPMVFGGRSGTAIEAEAQIAVACNGEVPVTVGLDSGANALGIDRRLGGSAGYVTYAVYSDPARQLRWDAGLPVAGVTDSGMLMLTAYGRVEPGATLGAAGLYADTIAVTVDF